jgi:phosphotriesterase-related protein
MLDQGKVVTVRGPIEADAVGVCSAHEHLLFDFAEAYYVEPDSDEAKTLGRGPITLFNRGVLFRNPFAIRANLLHDSISDAADEAFAFRQAGGSTIVEQTPIGCGRNAAGLKAISLHTGLNIVASTGFYIESGHPGFVRESTVDQLTDMLVEDLTQGMDGTTIRAGFLGDLGTTGAGTDDELKCLRAAALAHAQTGAAIGVHLDAGDRQAMKIIQLLTDASVRPERIVIEHLDEAAVADSGYVLRVAAEGVNVEFDGWGSEFYYGPPYNVVEPRDSQRAAAVKRLIDAGHLERVLVAQDIWLKQQMKRYGGDGYDCLLKHGLSRLLEVGVTDEQVRVMLVDNPKRLLPLSV